VNHNVIPSIKFKDFKTVLQYQNTIPLWVLSLYVQINPLFSIVLFAIMYTEQALRRDYNETKKKQKKRRNNKFLINRNTPKRERR
jgi:hypothetical protein